MEIRFNYDDGGRSAAGYCLDEVNDCTVRALSLVSGIGYKAAHKVMATRANRKPKHGAYMSNNIKKIQKDLPVRLKCVKTSGKVSTLIKEYGEGNTILCTVVGHAFAILNGAVHDMEEMSGNKRVVNAWIVVSK
jgi:hypothetical protein